MLRRAHASIALRSAPAEAYWDEEVGMASAAAGTLSLSRQLFDGEAASNWKADRAHDREAPRFHAGQPLL
jgi:hypothetical protein